MLHFNFSRKALSRTLLALMALFVATVSFTGCDLISSDSDDDPSIYGTWVSSAGEKWVITSSDLTNYYGSSTCYAGNNLVLNPVTSSSGYIYIKYTRAYCTTHSDTTNYNFVYDEDALDVGKWYGLYYKNLTDTSVSISGGGGSLSSVADLDTAKTTFTVENGYFSNFSECTKQ